MGKAEKNLPINHQQPQSAENVTPISTVPGKKDDFALVVFGRDEGGRPHASRFGAADAELAIKAAGLMRFRVLPITRNEQRAAASAVAQGRIFGSGKAFAPFCRRPPTRPWKRFLRPMRPRCRSSLSPSRYPL